MCTFVVAIVDVSVVDALRRVTPRIALAPIENRSLREYLGPREKVHATTTTGCDCDTFLGSGTRRQKGRKEQHEADAWRAFLDAAMKKLPTIGVLLHEYDGPLSGRVKIARTETVQRALVDDDWLAKMEPDVIYRITR
ncbi:MAG: hypothetical protein ACXWUG_20435 [Polyangiales bacterium]